MFDFILENMIKHTFFAYCFAIMVKGQYSVPCKVTAFTHP